MNLFEKENKTPPMTDWIEFICAEALLDEPTDFVCECGGDIVQRIDEVAVVAKALDAILG